MTGDCYACALQSEGRALAARERLFSYGGFHVAHAFNSSLEGWLVLVSDRHVEAMEALTASEADSLGRLVHATATALRAVTGCVKSYVLFLAEAERFHHLHVHVVPRAAGMPESYRGANVFEYLKQPQSAWVPVARMDEVALAVRAELQRLLGA